MKEGNKETTTGDFVTFSWSVKYVKTVHPTAKNDIAQQQQ